MQKQNLQVGTTGVTLELTAMEGLIMCPHCQKQCKSEGGLKQHIAKSQSCSHEQRKELVATRSLAHGSIQEPPHQDSNQPHFPRRSARVKKRDRDTTDLQANHADPEALQADPGAVEVLLPQANDQDPSALEPDSEPEVTASCLLYTSPSPRDKRQSRMPSSA